MIFKFIDILNRSAILFSSIALFFINLFYLIFIKINKLGNIESLPAIPLIVIYLCVMYSLTYRMDVELSKIGIAYTGKRSKWIKFKPVSEIYSWDEVSSISFNNRLKIIKVCFNRDVSIRFFAEPDKIQSFLANIKLYCPHLMANLDELVKYIDEIPRMNSQYDKSLFRGLSVGMTIFFIGFGLLIFFVLYVAIRQT